MTGSLMRVVVTAIVAAALVAAVPGCSAGNTLSRTPPMGWMAWEIFRCDITCEAHNDSSVCIDQYLFQSMADRLAEDGYLAAGYNGVHMDDCWMRKEDPQRDPTTNELRANETRFPDGMKALGDYVHSKGVRYAIYTAESTHTCAGYPASKGYEKLDANTFASWGVDYVKVDGCGDAAYYPTGYPLMGDALVASGRDIVFSCSWPAYLGSNESAKPYPDMIAAHCNLWRNWADIQCSWSSLLSIIDHWGDYGAVLQQFAGPGHWNDPDMLLIGNGCVTLEEERTQMAIWSISAAPLIMGNDLRNMSSGSMDILLNKQAIAIDQDPMGKMGIRVSPKGATEVWARDLHDGSVAVGLFNKQGTGSNPSSTCTWNETAGGYLEACGGPAGNEGYFSGLSASQAQDTCCSDPMCAGFSYNVAGQDGFYKLNTDCGYLKTAGYSGYNKPNFKPPTAGPQDITVSFADVGLSGRVSVMDVWTGETGSFTAKQVALHDTALFVMQRTPGQA